MAVSGRLGEGYFRVSASGGRDKTIEAMERMENMTGYPESLTDPSYKGQILVPTFLAEHGVESETVHWPLPSFMHCAKWVSKNWRFVPGMNIKSYM